MGKLGDLEKITVFENSPEGVVTVKFTEAAAAEIAVGSMDGAKMSGRQVKCEYFDGITDYRVKESEEQAQQRVEEFEDWLHTENPNKL
jgi:HIV Tat-specific factor 1